MAATATRIGAAARGVGDTLGVFGPRKVQREPAAAGAASAALGSSPSLSGDGSMLVRMRAVLHRHQCVQQQEAVSACMKQNKAVQPSAGHPCDCGKYINALLYCQQATAQHNYPSFANTAQLFSQVWRCACNVALQCALFGVVGVTFLAFVGTSKQQSWQAAVRQCLAAQSGL